MFIARSSGLRLHALAVATAAMACSYANAATPPEGATAAAVSTNIAAKNWALRLPKQERVTFKGVVNFDAAGGGPGAMLYPAPSVAGFAAGLITHGLLNAGTRSAEKARLETAADKVLEPYQPVLNDYKNADLMQRALEIASLNGTKKIVEGLSGVEGAGWMMDGTPVFSMTQDQAALVLDMPIAIYSSSQSPDKPAYINALRVISKPIADADKVATWSGNAGKVLKETSANLLATALELATRDLDKQLAPAAETQKTFRYQFGKAEQIERAQLIQATCENLLIKTLRGGLMSVPPSARQLENFPDCEAKKVAAELSDNTKTITAPAATAEPTAAAK